MRNHQTPELDPAVAEAVRRLYVQPVDPDRARRNVAMIAEAARLADMNRGPAVSAGSASRARRRRMPLWRPALAAAAALVAIPGGMATAGVHLPDALEAPYELVGISLPNQADDAARTAPNRSTRERPQTPAATTPARTKTSPSSSTSTTATTPAASAGERRGEERSQRAKRRDAARRAQRATPAVPATPAQPAQPGGRGTRATPATPARPAQPAAPAGDSTLKEDSSITEGRAPGATGDERSSGRRRGGVNGSDARRGRVR